MESSFDLDGSSSARSTVGASHTTWLWINIFAPIIAQYWLELGKENPPSHVDKSSNSKLRHVDFNLEAVSKHILDLGSSGEDIAYP